MVREVHWISISLPFTSPGKGEGMVDKVMNLSTVKIWTAQRRNGQPRNLANDTIMTVARNMTMNRIAK